MFTDRQKNKFIDFLEKYCHNNSLGKMTNIKRKEGKIVNYTIFITINAKEEFKIEFTPFNNFYLYFIKYKNTNENMIDFDVLQDSHLEVLSQKTKDFIKAVIEYFEGA